MATYDTRTDMTGAFSASEKSTYTGFTTSSSSSTMKYNNTFDFDASLSNAIYGNSDTVQPPAACVKFIIKAYDGVTPGSAGIDLSQYVSDLSNKADRSLSNLNGNGEARFAHVVIDSYFDSTTGGWWRQYADGWVEQGGPLTIPALSTGWTSPTVQVSLLKPMATNNYTLSIGGYLPQSGAASYGYNITSKTGTGFNYQIYNNGTTSSNGGGFCFVVYGMGATEE